MRVVREYEVSPCALHSCARCNLPVCSDNMEKTKATRLPSDKFELSYSLIFCLCWSEGEITTWSFIFVATVHSVCMLWNCLCHPEWFLFVEGLKIIIAFQYYRARFSNTHLTCVMLSRVPCSTQNTWLYMHVRKTVGRNTLFFNNLMKVAMCCASFGLPICHNHHHHLPPLNHLKGSITQTAVTGCHRDDRSALWWREV